MRTTIVVFGQLQPHLSPPDTMTSARPVIFRGRKFAIQNADDVALRDVNDPNAPLTEGQLLTIEHSELPSLDQLEHHADDRRVPVQTNLGLSEIYAYDRPLLPKDAFPISHFEAPGNVRRREPDARDLELLDRSDARRLALGLRTRR